MASLASADWSQDCSRWWAATYRKSVDREPNSHLCGCLGSSRVQFHPKKTCGTVGRVGMIDIEPLNRSCNIGGFWNGPRRWCENGDTNLPFDEATRAGWLLGSILLHPLMQRLNMKQLLVLLGATMLLLSVGTITLPYIQVVSLTMLCLVRLVHGMCLNIQGLQLGKPPSHEKRNTTTLGCCFFFGVPFGLGLKTPRSCGKVWHVQLFHHHFLKSMRLKTEAICLHAKLLPWLRQSTLLPGECPLQRGGGSNGRTLWEPHIARRLATGSIPVVWPSNFARRDLAQLTWPNIHGTSLEPPVPTPPPDVQFRW